MPEPWTAPAPTVLRGLALASAQAAVELAGRPGDLRRLCEIVAQMLRDAEPGSVVLTGDAATTSATARVAWLVEPLGPPAGGGAVGVAVVAAVDGTVVAAGVVDPERGSSFAAHLGGGAEEDGLPLQVSAHRGLAGSVVERGSARPAVVDLCRVAQCHLDAYVGTGPVRAAVLAGALIAEEAGAVVELPCPENGNLVLVASPGVFEPLRRSVA